MMSFSMYTVETPEDAVLVAQLGIYDLVINDSECENCGMSIGPSLDEFFPLVVIVHDAEETAWPICVDCSSPVLFPDEGDLVCEFDPNLELGD